MSRTPVEVVALSDLVESTPTRSCAYGSWAKRTSILFEESLWII